MSYLNLDAFIKKNHVFKRRRHLVCKSVSVLPRLDTRYRCGFFVFSKVRFELIYIRVMKRILHRKIWKKKWVFHRKFFWVFVFRNFLLTMKSKNSRMGAGVGSFIRVSSILKPRNCVVLVHYKYRFFLTKAAKFLSFKLGIPLFALVGRIMGLVVQ